MHKEELGERGARQSPAGVRHVLAEEGEGPGQRGGITWRVGGPGERSHEKKRTMGAPGDEDVHARSHGRSCLLLQVEDNHLAENPLGKILKLN